MTDPMHAVAVLVAERLAQDNIAFVEDDRVPALAETLYAFLHTAGIELNQPGNRPQKPTDGTPVPR